MLLPGEGCSGFRYYPFGMLMPGRSYNSEEYRYGFNGKEKDDETYGEGNALDFGARVYDSRLGRWLSVDRYSKAYPGVSPYSFALNVPTLLKDEGGNWVTDKDGNPIYTTQGKNLEKSKDGQYYFLIENRTYFTNDGKEVKAIKYLSMIKVENVKEVNKMFEYSEADLMNIPEDRLDYTYDCHGNTCFKDKFVYIPGSDEDNSGKYSKNPENIFRNSSEYESVKESELKEGDAALFGTKTKSIYGFESEMINHSATYNGDGTYTSKDDRDPLNKKATLTEMAEKWGGETLGYVRFKGNQNGNVDSKNGEVSSEVAQNAIKNVKERMKEEKKAAKEAKKAAKAAKN